MNVNVNGPEILFRIPLFGGIPITETIVNTWILMAVITAVCIFLTRGMKIIPTTRRQQIAEKLVTMLYRLVEDVMGKKYLKFAPYIGTLFTISIVGSLSSLVGMRPITADLSTTLGWALVTFVMVQANNIRSHGVGGWLKSFSQPIPFMTPLNIVSEIANPISMSFRHFGNIAAGMVITSLVYGALAALSTFVLQIIPSAFLQSIPIFQAGIPAFLSIYFDLFSSFLQAYIFCMLTMVFVEGAGE